MKKTNPVPITLLTDFGRKDSYAAQMEGVILSLLPSARIVHLGHDIPPQDIAQAGLFILTCYATYPKGTIHVIVVDPGVGTKRRILAVQTRNYIFLVPDNGLIEPVLKQEHALRIIEVRNTKLFRNPVSTTFHGRDCFAPAAAQLARGTDVRKLGPPLDRSRIRKTGLWPVVKKIRGGLEGTVISSDTFGNLITNIHRKDLAAARIKGRTISIEMGRLRFSRITSTYADKKTGSPVALFGSADLLEIAVNRSHALKQLTGKRTLPRKPIRVRIRYH